MSAATGGRDIAEATATRRRPGTAPAELRPRGGRGWIAFAAVNGLIVFFGLSYIFIPMGTVVADGNKTTGVLEVPREIAGAPTSSSRR